MITGRSRYPDDARPGLHTHRPHGRAWPRYLVLAAHALALGGAAAVPLHAVARAGYALFDPAEGEALAKLVDGQRWVLLLANTAIVCAVAVSTAIVLGGGLALLATRTNLPGRRLLGGAALFGACIPVYVTATTFFAWLSANDLRESAGACGVLYGLVFTPLAGLALGVVLRAADREQEEQARLNAGALAVLLRVTLPQSAWGLLAVGIPIFCLVATDYTIPDILQVRTFTEEVRVQYALQSVQTGPVLTAAPMLVVLAALLLAAQHWLWRFGQAATRSGGEPPFVFALGRWRWAAGVLCGLVLLLGLGLPLALLASRAGPLAGLPRAILGLQTELWTSAALAAAGATVMLLLAPGYAWHLLRGGRTRWLTAAALVLLLATPAPVIGISLITLLNNDICGWIYDSPLVVIIGYFVRFLPLTVLLLVPGVQRVARELEWAARVDGCDWLGEHRHVRWPLLWRDVAVAWLVAVVLCFGELGTTFLVVPPAWPVVSVRAFTLVHFGVYRDLAVLALLSVGFILVPWALLCWALHQAQARRARWNA